MVRDRCEVALPPVAVAPTTFFAWLHEGPRLEKWPKHRPKNGGGRVFFILGSNPSYWRGGGSPDPDRIWLSGLEGRKGCSATNLWSWFQWGNGEMEGSGVANSVLKRHLIKNNFSYFLMDIHMFASAWARWVDKGDTCNTDTTHTSVNTKATTDSQSSKEM